MRVFCWNVNSLVPTVRNINLKYGSLAAFFSHLDADIICMQEIKLPDGKLTKDLVVVEGYQSYWSCSEGKTGYSGVTTWARNGFAATYAEADPFTCEGCEKEGRAIMTDHDSFVLFNVYVPNAGDRPARARLPAKLSFLSGLKERVDEYLGAGRQVIIVGDLNIASEKRDVHDAINWDKLYQQSELQALHDLISPSGTDCVDTWRHLHPDTTDVYTVWSERTSARAFNVGMRIDYALVSRGLLHKVQSCEVVLDMPPKWSDHAPVMLQLDLQPLYAAVGANLPQQLPQQQQQTQQVSAEGPQPATAAQQLPQLRQPPECPMWQQLLRRFQDPAQRSIASMFKTAGQQKPSAKKATAMSGVAAGAATAAPPPTAAAGVSPGQAGMQSGNSSAIKSRGKEPHMPQAAAGVLLTSGVQAATADGQQTAQNSQGHPASSSQADPQQQQQCPVDDMAAPQQHEEQRGLPDQQQQQQSSETPSTQAAKQKPSCSTAGRTQQGTGTKRKAPSKKTSEVSKQPKLHAFFARAPTCTPGGQ